MRRPISVSAAAIAIALGASLSFVAAQSQLDNAAPPAAQPQAAPPQPQGQSPASQLAQPEQQRAADDAVHSRSGQGGKQEPGSNPARDQGPVLVDGKLNVPGAPNDSHTVPAKFSERNAALDRLPIMAFPLDLSDAQKQAIVEGVAQANVAVAHLDPRPADILPNMVETHEWPESVKAQVPDLANYKYVRLADRVVVVTAANKIVVGEIKS
jgi:phenylpyruvate tautomerase PptA (4-oxalocrotonate tautomerase family)